MCACVCMCVCVCDTWLTYDALGKAGLAMEVQAAQRGGGVSGRDEIQLWKGGIAGEERLTQLQCNGTEIDREPCICVSVCVCVCVCARARVWYSSHPHRRCKLQPHSLPS